MLSRNLICIRISLILYYYVKQIARDKKITSNKYYTVSVNLTNCNGKYYTVSVNLTNCNGKYYTDFSSIGVSVNLTNCNGKPETKK
jgi:hypothetical protein